MKTPITVTIRIRANTKTARTMTALARELTAAHAALDRAAALLRLLAEGATVVEPLVRARARRKAAR